ncbi:uncharacterized protein LOC126914535 [Bombus affinis]|uniref:uncharacterized protein LOC126914535 n=1 Tax=Bombus affinis TaxID=309941 RepID=UPI0021B6F45B|nr:uncharacterized protein LOC126914535 [Bombus affinis]
MEKREGGTLALRETAYFHFERPPVLALTLSYPIQPSQALPYTIYTKTFSIPFHFSTLPPRRTLYISKIVSASTNGLATIPRLFFHPYFTWKFDKMSIKFYAKSLLLFIIVGLVVAAENYIDYGDEVTEKTPIENIREIYKILMQRSALENTRLGETPLEHLMIRKSQRSPSLRLRFGRSDPRLSQFYQNL